MRILFYFACFSLIYARKHRLNIKNDDRSLIGLSTFGFLRGGELSVNLTNFHYASRDSSQHHKPENATFGFTLDKTSSSSISVELKEKYKCMLWKESTEDDGSVSQLYFALDEKEKCFRIDRKGKDIKDLRIYIRNDRNVLDGDGKERVRREDGTDGNGKNTDVKTNISSTTTTALPKTHSTVTEKPASSPAVKVQSVTTLQSTTSEPGIIELTSKLDKKQGLLKATNCIPVHIDSDGLMSAFFQVFIQNKKEEGLYNLYFHDCNNLDTEKEAYYQNVNMTLHIVEINGDNYLSAGDMPLPAFYFVLCLVYFFLACLWLVILKRATEGVFKTHYLMLSFLFVKSLSLLFHAIDYHFIQINGQHGEAFAILYYITYLMKGTLLLVTILLIGAGWSFIKHILSKREKKLFIIIIPLQILANVAQVIIQETEESTEQYTTWKMIFLMLDLLCCGAILFPVVWSIRHLQEASQTDGKAAINLAKLKIFRHFYILIVCYIYSTRIIAYLLAITLPFHYEWFCVVFKEGANIIFFVMTGVKFRPASDNPYLQIPQSDSEEEMEEVLTKSGAYEGVTRVNVRDLDSSSSGLPTPTTTSGLTAPKQRESSHEYD